MWRYNMNKICNIHNQEFDIPDIVFEIINSDIDYEEKVKKCGWEIAKITHMSSTDCINLSKIIIETGEIPTTFKSKTKPNYLQEHLENADKNIENAVNSINSRIVTITCPYCQSTNCSKIGILSRKMSFGLFGFGSSKLGKQWHCNSCKSNF